MGDYYTEELHGPHEYFELGDFTLESGVTLERRLTGRRSRCDEGDGVIG